MCLLNRVPVVLFNSGNTSKYELSLKIRRKLRTVPVEVFVTIVSTTALLRLARSF